MLHLTYAIPRWILDLNLPSMPYSTIKYGCTQMFLHKHGTVFPLTWLFLKKSLITLEQFREISRSYIQRMVHLIKCTIWEHDALSGLVYTLSSACFPSMVRRGIVNNPRIWLDISQRDFFLPTDWLSDHMKRIVSAWTCFLAVNQNIVDKIPVCTGFPITRQSWGWNVPGINL